MLSDGRGVVGPNLLYAHRILLLQTFPYFYTLSVLVHVDGIGRSLFIGLDRLEDNRKHLIRSGPKVVHKNNARCCSHHCISVLTLRTVPFLVQTRMHLSEADPTMISIRPQYHLTDGRSLVPTRTQFVLLIVQINDTLPDDGCASALRNDNKKLSVPQRPSSVCTSSVSYVRCDTFHP